MAQEMGVGLLLVSPVASLLGTPPSITVTPSHEASPMVAMETLVYSTLTKVGAAFTDTTMDILVSSASGKPFTALAAEHGLPAGLTEFGVGVGGDVEERELSESDEGAASQPLPEEELVVLQEKTPIIAA